MDVFFVWLNLPFQPLQVILSFLYIFFISLLIIITLITGTAFVIGYFYEDEVVGVVLKELNKNIKTEINIGSYEFSVFSKFPDASLEFKNITAKSTKNFESKRSYEDTLFTAKSIFLQFNILDIIKKHYTINAIHIDGADVRLITNKKGQENFLFGYRIQQALIILN